jgi:2-oxoglutarate ferredoxin oxidoreductase subunit alpha
MDLDGDGIPYRTLPGNKHPKGAHFNRGTGHNQYGVYSEDPQDLLQVMDRLLRKFDTARNLVPAPVIDETPGTEIAIIAYGSTLAAVTEARFRLAASGVNSSFLRLRALPINDRVGEFVGRHRRTYVVEMNRDGQMHQILSLELPALATRLVPIAFLDGWSLTADWITKQIRSKEGLD